MTDSDSFYKVLQNHPQNNEECCDIYGGMHPECPTEEPNCDNYPYPPECGNPQLPSECTDCGNTCTHPMPQDDCCVPDTEYGCYDEPDPNCISEYNPCESPAMDPYQCPEECYPEPGCDDPLYPHPNKSNYESYEKVIEYYRCSLDKCNQRNRELECQLKGCQEKNHELKCHIGKLLQDKRVCEQKLQCEIKKKEELTRKLAKFHHYHGMLKKKISELMCQLGKCQESNNCLMREVARLKVIIKNLECKQMSLLKQIECLIKDIKKFECENNHLKKCIVMLQQKLKAGELQKRKLELCVQTLSKRLECCKSKNLELEKQNCCLKKKLQCCLNSRRQY